MHLSNLMLFLLYLHYLFFSWETVAELLVYLASSSSTIPLLLSAFPVPVLLLSGTTTFPESGLGSSFPQRTPAGSHPVSTVLHPSFHLTTSRAGGKPRLLHF